MTDQSPDAADRQRRWRLANPERVAAISRAYRERNKEAVNRRKREWEQQNREHFVEHRAQYDRAYYQANKAKKVEMARADREGDQSKHLLAGARLRAKQRGLPCTITKADIVVPEFCPVLGIKLERNREKYGPAPGSPTLDRIVPALGYVPGNVVVISHKANGIKSNATAAEIRAVADWLARIARPPSQPEMHEATA